MLAISDSAAEAIEAILEHEEAPEGAGLRIGIVPTEDEGPRLGVGLAAGPTATDQVVEHNGATVFVDQEVSEIIGDKLLDAHREGDQVAFTMRDQSPA